MSTNAQPISVTYSDEKLRILVEEYNTMQKKEFNFKGVCSYIMYRAMEEARTKNEGLFKTNELVQADCERVNLILQAIIKEQRIKVYTQSRGLSCYLIYKIVSE